MRTTPGPWTFDEVGGNFYIWGAGHAMVADNDNEGGFVDADVVARMRGTGRGATNEEKLANAQLIAAAPELLEACRAAFNQIDPAFFIHQENEPAVRLRAMLRAAITKAGGHWR